MRVFDHPAEYASTEFENVSAAVLFCKEFLEKNGYGHEARKLEGLEVINNPTAAQVAYYVLKSMRTVNGDAREFVDLSRSMLEDILGAHRESRRSPS
jgi:hypothetical protein